MKIFHFYEIKFDFSINEAITIIQPAIKTQNFLSSGIASIDFLNNSDFSINSYFNKSMDIYKFYYSIFVHEFCHFLGLVHTQQLKKNNRVPRNGDWIIDKLKKLYPKPNFAEGNIIQKIEFL